MIFFGGREFFSSLGKSPFLWRKLTFLLYYPHRSNKPQKNIVTKSAKHVNLCLCLKVL